MALEFEWESAKAASNLWKHGVGFEEAVTVFDDPLSTTVIDPDHSLREERLVIFGRSTGGRILAVMHTEGGERVRVISAREVTRAERDAYEEEVL
jgi:uncharacterized DUF497 family protein